MLSSIDDMLVLVLLSATFAYGFPEEKSITEVDPKEEFFRNLPDDDEAPRSGNSIGGGNEEIGEIPKPGGFNIYYSDRDYHVIPSRGLRSHFQISLNRQKRSEDDEDDVRRNLKIAEEIKANIEKRLGKPLELVILEPENTTVEIDTEDATNFPTTMSPSGDVLIINDFIRFRRSTEDDEENVNKPRLKREREDEGDDRNEKVLESGNVIQEGSREPRGATKEQWIKHPYRVQDNNNNNYEEQLLPSSPLSPSSSDNLRAPRVHFVTQQRRSESIPPIVYRSYDRESRMRDFDRDYFSRPFYPTSSPPRHQYQSYHRYDPYYYDETRDRRYDSRFDGPNRDRDRYSFSNKQRRIIYYATLPDVVRTPPNVDLRDRYSFRDRYVTSPTVSVGDPYRFRKQTYSFNKSRYEQELDRNKAPLYPLKVSTDVNVREIKKNPERRIYSEADTRYAYKTPTFQTEENYNNRNQ